MYKFKQRSIAIILTFAVILSMSIAPVSAQTQSSGRAAVSSTRNVAPVTSVSAKAAAYNKIRLSWNDWEYDNDGYDIYRSVKKAGPYQKIKRINNCWDDSWTDTKVKTGKRYYYKMRSFGTVWEDFVDEQGFYQTKAVLKYSSFTGVVSAVTKLNKPSLTAKSAGKTKVKLSWKKVSGASGYKIYKYNSKKKKYTVIKTVNKGGTKSWTNKKLKTGKKVKYKIKAFRNVDGKKVYSPFSKTRSATPKAKSKSSGSGGTVYITNTGSKFHRGSCRYLSRSKIPISRSKAISQGYDPCKICRP